MSGTSGETLIAFAGFFILASFICSPTLGFGGIFAVACLIYFGLIYVNASGRAHKSTHHKHKRKH